MIKVCISCEKEKELSEFSKRERSLLMVIEINVSLV
jgi:hypothetical protein